MAGPPGRIEGPRRGRIAALMFLLALALLALVVLRAYETRRPETVVAEVPLLRADPSPIRERPAEPGGMEVPYQDTLIFETLGDAPAEPRIERLLPPPEEPLEAPVPADTPAADAALAAAGPAAGVPDTITDAGPPPSTPAIPSPVPPSLPEPEPETAALAPAAEAPPAPGAGFRVQVGAFRSPEEAAAGWQAARARAPGLLDGVGHVIAQVDLGERGVFHRLQAGPFPTHTSADSLCSQLKARQMDCFVVAP